MHHASLEWVEPKALTVLPHLQREVKLARVKKISDDWDPGLVGVIEAARLIDDNGEEFLHTIDGQTRGRAAERVGDAIGGVVTLPVVIYNDLTEEEVARLFLARNQLSQRVGAYDQYMVGLAAHDEIALTIRSVLNSTDFVIDKARANDVSPGYKITSVGSVMAIVKEATARRDRDHAKELLAKILVMVHDAWPHAEADRLNADILKALAWVLNENPAVWTEHGYDRLMGTLTTEAPRAWATEAKALKEAEPKAAFSTGQRFKPIVHVWTLAYNKNLGNTKPKLEPLVG